jgi:hypothetical protein
MNGHINRLFGAAMGLAWDPEALMIDSWHIVTPKVRLVAGRRSWRNSRHVDHVDRRERRKEHY